MGDAPHDAAIELEFDSFDELRKLLVDFGPPTNSGRLTVKVTFKYQGTKASHDWDRYRTIWRENIDRFLTVRPDNFHETEFKTGSLTAACLLSFAAAAFLTVKDYKDFRESIIALASDLRRAGEFLAKLVKRPPPASEHPKIRRSSPR